MVKNALSLYWKKPKAKKVNDLSKQPFYHLRPNKCIDRRLFVQTLIGLSRELPISDYKYTGFGSYLFDDFKLLHETLNISDMVSLEKDEAEFQRAQFNAPYTCITIKNTESSEYLSDLFLPDDEHNIFWLDFVTPNELGMQLADYVTLLKLLNANDIVRITLNANPDSLGKYDKPDKLQEFRLAKLKERVPEDYLWADISPNDVITKNYPITLLKVLKAATLKLLVDKPPYNPNFMLPLFSSVYADGQQMVTFTGIVLDSHTKEERIKEALKNYPHNNFLWDKPSRIEIPALSIREITEINKLLPNQNVKQQLIKDFPFIFSESDDQAVDSYINFYKYYPNYHQVNF